MSHGGNTGVCNVLISPVKNVCVVLNVPLDMFTIVLVPSLFCFRKKRKQKQFFFVCKFLKKGRNVPFSGLYKKQLCDKCIHSRGKEEHSGHKNSSGKQPIST